MGLSELAHPENVAPVVAIADVFEMTHGCFDELFNFPFFISCSSDLTNGFKKESERFDLAFTHHESVIGLKKGMFANVIV